jgi:hypothetical protein
VPVLRLLTIVTCATLNAGCAFLLVESNGSRRIDNPPLTVERAKLDCDALEKNATALGDVSRPQLKAAWGAPDNIEIINDKERWSYKTNLRWNGVWGLLLVVPIPFAIPTGREELVVEFSGDVVRTVDVHYQVGQEFGCGFVLIHGGGWYCANGEPNHYYGLRSSFCGYGKRLYEQPTAR